MTQPSPSENIAPALQRILETLKKLSSKLDQIIENQEKTAEAEKRHAFPMREEDLAGLTATDVMTLLSLPDHLRKAAMVVSEKGRVTAEDVSHATGRARAVESSYLNQLVNMGYLKKERKRRTVYFYISD